MNIKALIISIQYFLASAYGLELAMCGIFYYTWQYWLFSFVFALCLETILRYVGSLD